VKPFELSITITFLTVNQIISIASEAEKESLGIDHTYNNSNNRSICFYDEREEEKWKEKKITNL